MKVYTRIEIEMTTGEVLHEEFHEYEGDVSECKGGSSSSTSVDYAYNDRMATLSEEQQDWAREYHQFWSEVQKPMETEMVAANRDFIQQSKPVRDKFINETMNGINGENLAAQAGADVQQELSRSQSMSNRNAARLGINPLSGAYQARQHDLQVDGAKAVADVKNRTRMAVRDENYNRLKTAMGMGLSIK